MEICVCLDQGDFEYPSLTTKSAEMDYQFHMHETNDD